MKNKNGFTLIEIIGVVTVLSIILIVAVPSLTKTLKKNQQNKYNDYIDNLKIAAENYAVEKLKNGETIDDNLIITLGDLIDVGYVKEVMTNPENEKKLSRRTKIIVSKDIDGTFLYNIKEIYMDYIENVKIAAENYAVEKLKNGETVDDNLIITLGDLIDVGYVKEVITNPENEKNLSRRTKIIVSKDIDGTFLYNIKEIYIGDILDTCQLVEYIRATGTQYIITNIKPTNNTSVTAKYDYYTSKFLFGTQSNTEPYKAFGFSAWNPYYVKYSFANKLNAYVSATIEKDTITTVELNSSGIYIDGIKKSGVGTNTLEADYDMYIFANNNAGTPENYFGGNLYSLIVKENDVLTNNFVPCYRIEDDEIGLCDLVENKFYANAGTGEFEKGADVE